MPALIFRLIEVKYWQKEINLERSIEGLNAKFFKIPQNVDFIPNF